MSRRGGPELKQETVVKRLERLRMMKIHCTTMCGVLDCWLGNLSLVQHGCCSSWFGDTFLKAFDLAKRDSKEEKADFGWW